MSKSVFVLKVVLMKKDENDYDEAIELGDSSSIILGNQYQILKLHPDDDMDPNLASYILNHIELFEDKNYNFTSLLYIKDDEGNIEPLSIYYMKNFHRKVISYYITCNGNTIEKILPSMPSEDMLNKVVKYIKQEFLDFKK
jgi:hypothetical protein